MTAVGLKKAAEAPWQGQQRGYNRVAQHGFLSFRAKIEGRYPILSPGEKRKK
jgi:hypothetical protein